MGYVRRTKVDSTNFSSLDNSKLINPVNEKCSLLQGTYCKKAFSQILNEMLSLGVLIMANFELNYFSPTFSTSLSVFTNLKLLYPPGSPFFHSFQLHSQNLIPCPSSFSSSSSVPLFVEQPGRTMCASVTTFSPHHSLNCTSELGVQITLFHKRTNSVRSTASVCYYITALLKQVHFKVSVSLK